MKKNMVLIIGILLINFFQLSAQKNNKLGIDGFSNPVKQYKPMPFWHINGELTNDEILRQMTDARDAGFSGIAILPMHGTRPQFLSEDYFDQYHYILESAKDLDLEIILYDDIGFPSGSAGGEMEKKFPDDLRKVVSKHETVRSGKSLWRMPVPCDSILAAVAMNTETRERINLSEYIDSGWLTWNVPSGTWKILFFTIGDAPFWKSYLPVDYLDQEAVSNFIDLTYNKYTEQFQSYFGNTIKLTFFDDVGFLRTERTWTPRFNEKFKELHGVKPDLYYPALWYDIGPETEAARVALFNTRSELMAEGFPKMVTEWSKKYGLKNTGHPPGNYGIQPVDMHGDIFKYFRYTDIPLTDAIINYGRGRDGFKMISSAAVLYDRPIVSTEVYGAFSEKTFDTILMYRTIMELFARGVNFVVPHGMWYNPDRVGIPPLFSPESEKLVDELPAYSEYVGRACYMLQDGRSVADIALLYPIASLQGGFYFDAPDNQRAGTWAYPEADYLKISDLLTNDVRSDFTFVHPEYLATDQYEIRENVMHLNNAENFQDYKLIIIPGGKVIAPEVLEKVHQFYKNGGKVIATTLLPSVSSDLGQENAKVTQLVNEIFGANAAKEAVVQSNEKGGKALFIPNPNAGNLGETIQQFLTQPDIIFENNPKLKSEQGKFSYLHKIKDGKNIFFFANSSDDAINTDVLLKGDLNLESWNPHDGAVSELEKPVTKIIDGETYTRYPIKLEPVRSVFWVEQ